MVRVALNVIALTLLSTFWANPHNHYLSIAAAPTPWTALREPRAVWIWSSTVRTAGAETVAETLKQSGITDAILLVKGTGGTLSWATTLGTRDTTTVDTLAVFLAACHKRGIRVHAWLAYHQDDKFAAKTGYKYPIYHCPTNTNPNAYSMADGRICPLRAKEEYNAYFLSLVNEILANYAVDGIHLDYIRYGHTVYCFCPAHQAAMAAQGISYERIKDLLYKTYYSPADQKTYMNAYANGDSDAVKWVGMRAQEINDMVAAVKGAVDGYNGANGKSVALSASLMPEGALTELVTDQAPSDKWALCFYAQKYEDMAAAMQFIAPMSYYADYGKTPSWVGKVAAGAVAKANGTPVLAGIEVYNSGSVTVTPQSVATQIYSARWNGAAGLAIFRYGVSTAADNNWKANVPTTASLASSTENEYTSGNITSASVNTGLQAKLTAAQGGLDLQNSSIAENQMLAYLGDLDAQSGTTIDARSARVLAGDAHWILDRIQPALTMNLTSRAGGQTARVWTFTWTNQGPGLAYDVRLTGLTLQQTAGAACTPVTSTPFPVVAGGIAESSWATGQVTISFAGCPYNARFKVTAPYTANNGAVSGTRTIINQIP